MQAADSPKFVISNRSAQSKNGRDIHEKCQSLSFKIPEVHCHRHGKLRTDVDGGKTVDTIGG